MDTELALLDAENRPDKPPLLKHWYKQVAGLGCLITRHPEPTLHHIHSGSCGDNGYKSGMGLRGVHPYLVIPLRADLHCVGQNAIDGGIGVRTWETHYGDQVAWMDEVCRRTGVNAWRIAGIDRDPYQTLTPRLRVV
jgi:hypothetical protein